ncbi:hypothetical protein L0Y47_07195 [Ectopseudomonas composti]
MSTPITTFLTWFHTLPPSHKIDIAALISFGTPGFAEINLSATDTIVQEFEKVILDHSTSDLKDVGAAVTLRSALDFFFITRGDREEWKENEALTRSLAEQTGSDTFQKLADEMPLRREQWLRTCALWEAFRDEHLTDQMLMAWSREQAAKRAGA